MRGLTAHEVLHLLRHLLPNELRAGRAERPSAPEASQISSEARLDAAPIRADSLDRLNLASTLNRFFCLHETGVEDRLLALNRIGDIAELIAEATEHTSGLVFRTSGSTGSPQPHHHSWAALTQEAQSLAHYLGPHGRAIAWLPTHHVYGFINAIAVPRELGAEVIQAPEAPEALFHDRRETDLIVTVPARWRYLSESINNFPASSTGISSTAPLDAETCDKLRACGLRRLVEIYGSTETGGIGVRAAPDREYQLLHHWERSPEGELRRQLPDGTPLTTMPLDYLEWRDERHFQPAGRVDDVVPIGGINVSPSHVARRIEEHPQVAACSVRSHGEGTQQRLKAFIVPAEPSADTEQLHQELEAWLWEHLAAAERPTRLTFGEALPRNELGKLQDWE